MEGAICFGCCDRFWGLGVRSLFGVGSAIAVGDVGERSLLGMWESDRCWGCGDAIAKRSVGIKKLNFLI
jgi:hypothetical protein